MQVEIKYNGKTVKANLTSKQMREIGLQDNKTGWQRVGKHNAYSYMTTCGEVRSIADTDDDIDNLRIQYGNYFSDPSLAELMAKAVGLYLRMQRWADEHNTGDTEDRFEIIYDCGEVWGTGYRNRTSYPFVVYFSTKELAQQALKEFESDLNEIFVNGLWQNNLSKES